MPLKNYLVVGLWEDGDGGLSGNRWADSFDAETPQEAEQMAREMYGEGLCIAGVITLNNQGEMEVVS